MYEMSGDRDTDCKKESEIRARCVKRSRKYTLKDLNELRRLKSYRKMPTNIVGAVEILAQGLGLQVVITNSLTTAKEVRLRQIQIAKNLDGYKNYISLIPNKNERRYKIHPTTPPAPEILALSKKHFDRKIRNWKREIHCWDGINSNAEIPYHLLTDRMLNERNKTALTSPGGYKSHPQYTWSPKKPSSISPKSISEKKLYNRPQFSCKKKLEFDMDDFDDDKKENDEETAVYSPTKHKWYKPKNGVISNGVISDGVINDDDVTDISTVTTKITKVEAIECLKICISNVRSKGEDGNQDNHFNDMLVNEFKKLLSEL